MDDTDFLDDDPFMDDEGQVDGADYLAEDSDDFDNYFDIDQYADRKVRVKVDGEEIDIPVSELKAGYQRQADYTRKTQELARERQDVTVAAAIKKALEQDPAGTLRVLANQYGVNFGAPAPQPVQQYQDPWDIPDDFTAQTPQHDPRWDQLEARIARYEQREIEQQLEQNIARLSTKYPDFDPPTVIAKAIELGTSDLEAVYKATAFDRLMAQQAEAQRTQAAKRQARVVEGGTSVRRGADSDVGEIRSIKDAWAAAKRELGVS